MVCDSMNGPILVGVRTGKKTYEGIFPLKYCQKFQSLVINIAEHEDWIRKKMSTTPNMKRVINYKETSGTAGTQKKIYGFFLFLLNFFSNQIL